MPRTFSAAALAALIAAANNPCLFVSIAFANETLYMFSGVGTITPTGPPAIATSTFPYGQTWTGLGWLGKISAIPQTTKVQAQNITLSLSGIPSQLVLDAVNQVRTYGTATIWLGFFDSSGNLILDPIQVFSGALDVPTLTDGADTCDLSITCESPLVSLNLAPNRRFDDADQQLKAPGDLGLSFVNALGNLRLFWPAPVASASPYEVSMTVTPNGADITVGGTVTLTVTLHWSNSTTTSSSSGRFASTNPQVATVDQTTGVVTGIAPGVCSIVFRRTTFNGTVPNLIQRCACSVIVRSI